MKTKWRHLTAFAFAIGLGGAFAVFSASGQEGEHDMQAHLTMYVGGELLRDGGTVIVSSIPVPEAELKAMTGPNPAHDDPGNAKRAQLSDGDVLLGAHVTGRANFVEMYYPEGGTFGFNLVVDPREETSKDLTTERLLVGSSRWPDPDNPEEWIDADVSTIYVDGPNASRSESRIVRTIESRVNLLEPQTTGYQGVRVKTPTGSQLKEASAGEVE